MGNAQEKGIPGVRVVDLSDRLDRMACDRALAAWLSNLHGVRRGVRGKNGDVGIVKVGCSNFLQFFLEVGDG